MTLDRAEVEAALEVASPNKPSHWPSETVEDYDERYLAWLQAHESLVAVARAWLESPTTEEVEVAIGRAIGVYSTGGLSNAMYRATDPEDVDGYAVDVADWETITEAARRSREATE